MSGRRDRRPPTGKYNHVNERPKTATGQRSSQQKSTDSDIRPQSASQHRHITPRSDETHGSFTFPTSARSDSSQLSTNEILFRIRAKSMASQRAQEEEDIKHLGPYNAFSRPRASMKYPLRSVFLDPEVNNFPRSRTRTELLRRIKLTSVPHPTYDIDGDGWVSQEDYQLSKRFDLDGNGVIDPQERVIAKNIIADEFFKANKKHLKSFGEKVAKQSHQQNVSDLANAYCFERKLCKLRETEEAIKNSSSEEMVECMALQNERLLKDNFFSDKYDTCAWTDFERLPSATLRSESAATHHGSRKRLLLARKEALRIEAERAYERVASRQPKYDTRRIALITNVAMEN